MNNLQFTLPHKPWRRSYQLQAVGAKLFESFLASVMHTTMDDVDFENMEEPTADIPHHLPQEKLKTFIAFLFMLLNFFLTTISLSMIHERTTTSPLSDIILDNVDPNLNWGLFVSEYLLVISVNILFVVIVCHKHRFIVLRRLFVIMGLLYLLRAITMYVTVLPLANDTYYCAPQANTSLSFLLILQRSATILSGFGLSMNEKQVYCGDYIYSGHTVVLVICYLFIKEYTPRRFFLLHWLTAVIALLGMSFILISKAHYTIDVIVAYYVTTRVFWVYHTMANNKQFKRVGPNNYLARVWWFPIFKYFERNVNDIVPYRFNLPFQRSMITHCPPV
ncbi:hypothetical protein B566_EDAN008957 [Ephemera danica]|nr:hypothetical protein B566_EDAN008957 [Ephemera danica]